MKKKLLCCALLAGMSLAQSAMAQSYDDRWYISAGVGAGFFDNDRNVDADLYGMLGLGKFISPNISVDAELWHSNPKLDQSGTDRNWEMLSLMLVGRYHFIEEGRNWNPYIAAGIGAQEHHDGTQIQPISLGYNHSRVGTDIVGLLGLGAQTDLGRVNLRGELGVRFDNDDGGTSSSTYIDPYAGIAILFPLGDEMAPAAEPAPMPQKTCADLDDDGDGVNNCNDKCPGSTAGEAVGPDGCPVPPPAPEPVMEPKPFKG